MRRTIPSALIILGFAVPVRATHAPRWEFATGYAAMHHSGVDYGPGFYASLCSNVGDSLGVVLDTTGSYRDGEGGEVNVYSLHGGLRLTHRRHPALTPYVQVLAGFTGGTDSLLDDIVFQRTDVSIQPGIGVVLRLNESIGLGLGADFRSLFERKRFNEYRGTFGIVFRLPR